MKSIKAAIYNPILPIEGPPTLHAAFLTLVEVVALGAGMVEVELFVEAVALLELVVEGVNLMSWLTLIFVSLVQPRKVKPP